MKVITGNEAKEATTFMYLAANQAEMAMCLRAKCGAVIVSKSEVIGNGYNAPPLDKEENRMCFIDTGTGKPKYDKTCCIHAEWRAILDALRRNSSNVKGSTLYFTRVNELGEIIKSGQPFCTVCSRLALDVGIAEFVLWHDEGITSYPTNEYNKLSYQYNPTEADR